MKQIYTLLFCAILSYGITSITVTTASETSKREKKKKEPRILLDDRDEAVAAQFKEVVSQLKENIYLQAEAQYQNYITTLEKERDEALQENNQLKPQLYALEKSLKWWKRFNFATILCLSGISLYWIAQWHMLKQKTHTQTSPNTAPADTSPSETIVPQSAEQTL